MNKVNSFVILLFVVSLGQLHAQGNPAAPQASPPPQPKPAPAPATAPTPAAPKAAGASATAAEQKPTDQGSELSALEGFLEPFIYDVVNRRDPFLAFAEFVTQDMAGPARPLSPAQKWDLDQLKLVAVMWDVRDPKAMFLDPDSEVIVLGRDEGIGNHNGYIASIREGEVVVVEALRKRGDIIYKTKTVHIER